MIVTWFVSVTTFVVAGMWLFSRWIVRALAAPEFFESYKTIGLVSTGVMLYALYLVLVVVLGRTGRTEFNFPATAAGTVTNIGLNLLLLPSMGIVGAGISLVASYAVVLVLMYVFTQRLFPVPYEWGRLAQALGLAAILVAAGELLLPTSGADGLAGRVALRLAYPLPLWATGFLNEEERRRGPSAARSLGCDGPPPRPARYTPGGVPEDCAVAGLGSPARRSRPSSATRTRSARRLDRRRHARAPRPFAPPDA